MVVSHEDVSVYHGRMVAGKEFRHPGFQTTVNFKDKTLLCNKTLLKKTEFPTYMQ